MRPRPVGDGLVAVSLAAFVVATALGVALRWWYVGPVPGLAFDHVLHAHSHVLYFGWAGLAIWALAIRLAGLAPTRGLVRALGVSVALLPPLMVAFLTSGYAPVSIAVSTLMMLTWYVVAWSVWRGAPALDLPGLHLRAAAAYVVVASLGVWVLAALQASGTGTELSEALAVHAFLNGFGWFFVLGVAGLLLAARPELGLTVPAARRALVWWAALGWATFPLSVPSGPEVGWIGPVARLAALVLLYPAAIWVYSLWRARPAGMPRWTTRVLAVWLAAKALMEAGVAVDGTALLVAGGRQGIVVYLHAVLLGFVSSGLLLLASLGRRSPIGWLAGFTVLLAVMLVMLPAGAFVPAAIAATGLWAVGAGWSWQIARCFRDTGP